MAARAARNLLDALLDSLSGLRAKAFVAESKTAASLNEFGLEKPEYEVALSFPAAGQEIVFALHKEGEALYATTSQSTKIITFEGTVLADLDQVGEHVVVDGGVARNVPVDVVRNMGADVVIAVDVGMPLATMTTGSGVLAIAGQVTGLLTVRSTREQLATLRGRDVLVTPPLGDLVATKDFTKGPQALAIGNQGADAATGQLAQLAVAKADYAQNLSVRTGRQTTPPVVQFVRLDNRSRYRDDLLLSRIDVPLGQPLDSARLEAALYRVYGITTLSQATYEVVEALGTHTLAAGEHALTFRALADETKSARPLAVEMLRVLRLPPEAARTVKTHHEAHFIRLGIGRAVYAYRLANGALPESLEALVKSGLMPARYLADENNRPLKWRREGDYLVVESDGPQGWTYRWQGLDARR